MVQSISEVIVRDLRKLREEINLYSSDDKLWVRGGNIANPAGNLCLHLVGNLNTYIGYNLGNIPYTRNRDQEFSLKGLTKNELISKVDGTIRVVTNALERFPDSRLGEQFPIRVLDRDTSIQYMLVHLAAHLSYHLGQVNYHRRLFDIH